MGVRHSHTFLAGLVGGLALDSHSFVLFGAGVLAGAGAVLVAGQVAALLRWGRRRLEGGRV